ncbi:MAG: leucine-rich repeat domain-containing protein [Prevotellaceae bacterium]|jgi:hypothetical protein|nr:leucine-rich repeat domain-containing protein [Prevotellaceae bacterium]
MKSLLEIFFVSLCFLAATEKADAQQYLGGYCDYIASIRLVANPADTIIAVTGRRTNGEYTCPCPNTLGDIPTSFVSNYSTNGSQMPLFGQTVKITVISNGFAGKLSFNSSHRTNLQQVFIPEGYEKIDENGFYGCRNLVSVTLPSTLKEIASYAFHNDSILTSINFPDGLEYIAPSAFTSCGLPSVTLPAGLTEMGYNAFQNCPKLTVVNYNAINCRNVGKTTSGYTLSSTFVNSPVQTLNVGSGVIYLPRLGVPSVQNVNLPEGLQIIGDRAFNGCTNLTSITIPASVRKIENEAFRGTGLTSISIPATCDTVATMGFYNCTNLTEAFVASRVIGSSAFGNCSNLRNVTLSSDVNSIGSSAFQNCTSLISLEIPASVTFLDDVAYFRTCTSMQQLKVNWETPYVYSKNTLYPALGNITLIVPRGTKAAYQAANMWKQFRIIEDAEPSAAPSDNSAIISWYEIPDVTGYALTVYNDPARTQVFGAYSLNAAGQPQSAPLRAASDERLSYTVSGISAETPYWYTITILNATDTIAVFDADFATTETIGIATAVNTETAKIVGYYTILGQKLNREPKRGIYIILYDNGKTEKQIKTNN